MSDRSDIPGRGFLGRWSERKQAARETIVEEARKARGGAAPALPEEAPEPALPELYNGDEREMTDEERAVVATLPDIDSLHADSDFTAFMQSNVPEFLRRRALKALWRLNPILANVDGLVDYGEDYTDAARVIEGMQTAYKVGRGFLTDEDLGIEKESDEEGTEDGEDVLQAEADSSEQKRPESELAESPEVPDGEESDDDVGDGDLV
ncbi:DUF3306 domain-containing protein [Nisaea sediminum]|uniref:DUF3306 domain-containing protein n=1 Tax=Nisaea sediminum TaxID=2775867 RepID=UPI001D026C25|nr:DUF3306 domain-containing protein [Nisaea sediminum]